ncbi:integrase core domain-containing protein [Peristeroidobacter soli]|uniref:integrase core domain-containing protein n=1 Tax=Peristeroidobacter soli TaxID=2497877 RepID=UPI00101C91C9|nr:integrase core domain-containing protein [Peristeroidobacter soli]
MNGENSQVTHPTMLAIRVGGARLGSSRYLCDKFEFATHRPATLLRFHRALIRRKYQWLFSASARRRPGPKGPPNELIAVILEIKRLNPRFGCPRIAQQISHAFGLEIDKDVVRRILATHPTPKSGGNGPSWLSVIAEARDSLWSVDLFRCESILLKSFWVMVVMDVFSRRIVGFGVEPAHIAGISVCHMFNEARCGQPLPKQLSSDHDPLFRFHRWRANLRVLDIEELKSVPFAPRSQPFIERLIGTLRREYLDQTFFWNGLDLHRKLDCFALYYNQRRVHAGLNGRTPVEQCGTIADQPANLNHFAWRLDCSGLFHTPTAA